MEFEPTLEQEIRKGQLNDEKIKAIKELIKLDKAPGFRVDADGTEAHETTYSIHPGSEKMYQDLKQKFWWVKAEHQKPAGLLRPLKIPEWKWEEIGMDFIVGLPRTQSGFDSIWVVVDRLTKVAHFIPVKTTYSGAKLAELYMSGIVCLHGVPKKIVSDRGTRFTSHFWKRLHESMGTNISSTDRWADLKNQPDIRRYVESLRNTICYQASMKMSPFRALYGRRCGTPLHWDQPGEKQLFGPGIIEDAERQVRMIRENLRIAQTRREERLCVLESITYSWFTPIQGEREISTRYIGPFKIIDRKGEVAYQPELHDRLSGVHDVFHVSRLKKCTRVPEEQLREDELNVRDDLTYTEYPGPNFGDGERGLPNNGVIKMCKVKWSHHTARGGHLGKRG
ncbi:hypothetical protein U9M48_018229 [Paspalum notatum var. saurae]|uniref:Integrase catalytic domain-containing protein n=1 Tax=Paspalum notatum var. saurae TaxID=547442 RepID=A0AAQ3TCE2_PASNO